MSYEKSLVRLEQEKKELEKITRGEDEERRYELIKKVISGYSKRNFASEVSAEKLEKIFSKVYGFAEQKKTIEEILLREKYRKARKIKSSQRAKKICFVGPPGVGKTFFSNKFAEALGRKHFKIELGGASNAAIIRGSKKVWSGSEQGKIIEAIVKTQSCNPVILLDEVDKTGEDKNHGRVVDALLHVLDEEQNQRFTDDFLNVAIDISEIIFLLTANNLEEVPEPLKNRLKTVELKEYDEEEKFEISKIIIEKIFEENYENKNRDLFEIKEEAMHLLISKVKEPGMRSLEDKISDIIDSCFAQWSRELEKGEEEQKIIIDEEKVIRFLPKDDSEEENDPLRKKIKDLQKEKEDLESKSKIMKKQISKYQTKNSSSQQISLPWAIGGGIVLTLFGCFCGWFLTENSKKKKKQVKLYFGESDYLAEQ